MKKILLSLAAVFAFGVASAQETKFGVKAGFTSQSVKVSTGIGTVSGSASGFYIGGFADIGISDKFHFQPEVLYSGVSGNNTINVPLLGKYSFAEKFNVLFGPGLNYSLDALADEFSVSGDIGVSYDIDENFLVDARYDIGLTGDAKVSGLFVGAGYRF